MTYVVAIDPNGARSTVVEFPTFEEARARVDREIASRLNGRGGSVTFSLSEESRAISNSIYRVGSKEEAHSHRQFDREVPCFLPDTGEAHYGTGEHSHYEGSTTHDHYPNLCRVCGIQHSPEDDGGTGRGGDR